MKTILSLALAVALASGLCAASDTFPRIGGTYRIDYPISEARAQPRAVKVVARGSGEWYLVEYEWRQAERVEGQTVMREEVRTKWINFAVLLGATEQIDAEPDESQNPEKSTGDERSP